MPEKNFQPGKGTTWEIGNPLQEITGIRAHPIPAIERPQIDFTGNTDEGEEFVNGPQELSQELTLAINYDPEDATHNWLLTNVGTRQPVQVTTKKIVAGAAAADGFTWNFDANIQKAEIPSHGNNEPAMLNVVLKKCGKITRATVPPPP